jgi:hypothetical protein
VILQARRDDQHEVVATAAARIDAIRPVSPELALVDATLAEELRASLPARLASGVVAPRAESIPSVDIEPKALVAAEIPTWRTEPSSDVDASDLIVGAVDDQADKLETTRGHSAALEAPPADNRAAAGAAPNRGDASDVIVAQADQGADVTEPTSGYPSLPTPEGIETDPMEATEAALREIRARLGGEAREKQRRSFRSRFTVALGATTLLVFAVVMADLYYGVGQLPV